VAGLATTFGSGAMTNSINDIGKAACIFSVGSNTTAAHPVIALEVIKAKRNGSKLIVANPREIELCGWADLWLRLNPGTDVALLMGMMRVIVDDKLYDKDFITKRCENFEEFCSSLKNFDLDIVSNITGINKEQLIQAARMFASNRPANILYAMGITQHSHGTDNVKATANLAMLTGNIGKPGSGLNPLRGQNNVQGCCDMGCLPGTFPGYQAVDNADINKKFEKAWECKLNQQPGMTLTEIMSAAHHGDIKSIFLLVGENPLLSEPTLKHIADSLGRLDFLVVQDIFMTETAEFAHVILPAASYQY
jgi:formate dehydrogenase alpha subunit